MAEGKYGEVLYERASLKVSSLILLSSGDGFALRDLCEPRHHRCGVEVQDLRARFLANLRFRKRLAGPLAAEFGSIGAAHDTPAPYKWTAASIARGPNELQSTYTFARRKRDDGSSSCGVSNRQR